MQVIVTPYLWLPGVDATTKTPLAHEPQINSSVSAVDVLQHLNEVPFMGSAEIRDGPISFYGDMLHVGLGTGITTRDIFFSGGNATLTMNTGTALLLYHVIDEPVQSLDAGGGFRSWGFSANLSLNGRLLPSASVTRSGGWGDPLIALRYHRELGQGFGVTAYGDVGGFGVGAHVDWQLMGTIDYTLKPWVALHLGYRSLNFNYQSADSHLGFDVNMNGPLLAASFRF
jgi:hypothetical protein